MANIDDIINGTFSQLGYGGAPAPSNSARGLTLNVTGPVAPPTEVRSPYMTPEETRKWNEQWTGTSNPSGLQWNEVSPLDQQAIDAKRAADAAAAARAANPNIYPAWISKANADFYNQHGQTFMSGQLPGMFNLPGQVEAGIPVLNKPGVDPWDGLRMDKTPRKPTPGVSLGHVAAPGVGVPGKDGIVPMGTAAGYTYGRASNGAIIKTGRDPRFADVKPSLLYDAVNSAGREAAGRRIGHEGSGGSSGGSSGNLGGVSASGRRYDYDRNTWVGGPSGYTGGSGSGSMGSDHTTYV